MRLLLCFEFCPFSSTCSIGASHFPIKNCVPRYSAPSAHLIAGSRLISWMPSRPWSTSITPKGRMGMGLRGCFPICFYKLRKTSWIRRPNAILKKNWPPNGFGGLPCQSPSSTIAFGTAMRNTSAWIEATASSTKRPPRPPIFRMHKASGMSVPLMGRKGYCMVTARQAVAQRHWHLALIKGQNMRKKNRDQAPWYMYLLAHYKRVFDQGPKCVGYRGVANNQFAVIL